MCRIHCAPQIKGIDSCLPWVFPPKTIPAFRCRFERCYRQNRVHNPEISTRTMPQPFLSGLRNDEQLELASQAVRHAHSPRVDIVRIVFIIFKRKIIFGQFDLFAPIFDITWKGSAHERPKQSDRDQGSDKRDDFLHASHSVLLGAGDAVVLVYSVLLLEIKVRSI